MATQQLTTTRLARGWHQDPGDPTRRRFWDGAKYTAEMRLYQECEQPSEGTPTPQVVPRRPQIARPHGAQPQFRPRSVPLNSTSSSARGQIPGQYQRGRLRSLYSAPPLEIHLHRSMPAKSILGIAMIAVLGLTITGAVLSMTVSPTRSAAEETASAVLTDLRANNFSKVCSVALPTEAAKCAQDAAQMTAGGMSLHSLAAGSLTLSGYQGLFLMTGVLCSEPGICAANNKTLAGRSGESFEQAYISVAEGGFLINPMLVPLVEVNGTWYATGF